MSVIQEHFLISKCFPLNCPAGPLHLTSRSVPRDFRTTKIRMTGYPYGGMNETSRRCPGTVASENKSIKLVDLAMCIL